MKIISHLIHNQTWNVEISVLDKKVRMPAWLRKATISLNNQNYYKILERDWLSAAWFEH